MGPAPIGLYNPNCSVTIISGDDGTSPAKITEEAKQIKQSSDEITPSNQVERRRQQSPRPPTHRT